MIRPATEIEYPASEAQRARAAMLQRLEMLNESSQTLMAVIADRIGAEHKEDIYRVNQLTAEQERLIANMRALVKG
jgi:hypothetical protein